MHQYLIWDGSLLICLGVPLLCTAIKWYKDHFAFSPRLGRSTALPMPHEGQFAFVRYTQTQQCIHCYFKSSQLEMCKWKKKLKLTPEGKARCLNSYTPHNRFQSHKTVLCARHRSSEKPICNPNQPCNRDLKPVTAHYRDRRKNDSGRGKKMWVISQSSPWMNFSSKNQLPTKWQREHLTAWTSGRW